jgi:DNA-dependent protein kinase catalytic subunit
MITIRGNDEKEYKFLVKGGEDQRQDQRVELLFDLMNDLLRADSQCYRRNLSLRTYQVTPMTDKVAIIEWVNNTRTFKDIVRSALTENELERLIKNEATSVSGRYQNFISKASKIKPESNAEMFGNVYLNYKRAEVVEKFEEIQNMIPADLFRRFLRSMSNSTEGYFLLRNQFVVSYAVASICQYILGIGDRHLSNWMIDTKTGQTVGIDFGMAFGHATLQLPIPELMPIRLTRQLLKLNAPLEQNGILEATMIHTLNALRENHDLLLCMLDVFIREPSVDWIVSCCLDFIFFKFVEF